MSKAKIDTSSVQKYLDDASTNLKEAEVKGLNEVLTELVTQTKTNLLARIPAANRPIRPKHVHGSVFSTAGDTMLDSIRRSIHKKGTDSLEGTVHVLGVRERKSGTYVTRFFEGGTVVRKSATFKNRGQIGKKNFFADAVKSVNPNIDSLLLRSVENTINKLNSQNG
jgi:hypothetical protein